MTEPARRQSLRLSMRSAVGTFMCAVGAFGVSCQGDNCTTAPSDPGALTSVLASKYILGYVQNGTMPYKYADSAGYQLRVWSDTITLSTNQTYGERGRIGRLDPVSGDELIRNYALAGTNSYTLDAAGNPSFPKLLAGSGVAKKEPGYSYASLTITINGTAWFYYPAYVP
jgi:hypothetical protein